MKNKGQKLLKKAKNIIPGGNQLLSKRSEMFLPELWPSYYKKVKGCSIWDLDNNHYFDFCGMGVTSCVLGYSDQYVNKKVIEAINSGNMSTLNTTDEYELAKLLTDIHKWASMCKFTKAGGEACAVAVRIARAYSGKDQVAICGYHGWHDWYLALNISNPKNLDTQLLPGLKTVGVPKSLSGTANHFFFNDKKSFDEMIKKSKDLGVIIMEVQRQTEPDISFIKHVKNVAKKLNIVLVFDEITSGFHENYGGIHLKYNITPDIAIFGKALGNGYPIAAIIGKKKIMDISQDTFISSTMWTEKLGFSAAIATLKKMKEKGVQKYNVANGKYLKTKMEKLADKHELNFSINGFSSMPNIKFNYSNSDEIMTFFTQEMLSKGFLAGGKIVLSYKHSKKIINSYIKSCDDVFKTISFFIKNKRKIPLKGPIKHNSFQRLTK